MKIYLAGTQSRPYVIDDYMKIYLAGGASGNNNAIWRTSKPEEAMKIFLSAPHSNNMKDGCDEHIQGEAMKIYLAGIKGHDYSLKDGKVLDQKICILESFYYIKDWMIPYINKHWEFMLDSGAFTFMQNAKIRVDWDEYTERYAQFIVKNNIQLFFELDIDSVVGIKEVERLRAKLEHLTNKQSIPVWHISRGKDYFLKMVDEYKYVAIGGLVGMGYKKEHHKYFNWFLQQAKIKDVKVHGLGFTSHEGLKKYKFDSVDSTAWLYGNRGGFVYVFRGGDMQQIQAPPGKKLKSKDVAIHNFREWVKYQKYARVNL